MTTNNRPHHPGADLRELAYPYAMHAVTDVERRRIERKRAVADRACAAEFDVTVGQVRETLAALSILDAVPPPAGLEHRLLRALEDAVPRRRARRLLRRNWLAATMALLIAIAAGVAAATQRGRYRRAIFPVTDTLAVTVAPAGDFEQSIPTPIARANRP
ncbi:RskA family anti-sigma factor [Nocardia lijiangensis]|uniref:RskA family anti-sigma factor n=1 Tax=Nocardia lijiangensis TaxID=299618 RepID=UPI00082FC4C3|nr:hypothetical protein [Nocardia lijiangensis]